MSALNNPIFHDAEAARKWLEAHLWADGRACGHCGTVNDATAIETRPGLYQCNACRKQFTVTVGTLFERSHIPLNKWLLAIFLICASKKGMSAHQMHRMLGITYKSTWFMCIASARRCARANFPARSAARTRSWRPTKPTSAARPTTAHYEPEPTSLVVSLVERDGAVRSFHVPDVDRQVVSPDDRHASRKPQSYLMTDESGLSSRIGREFQATAPSTIRPRIRRGAAILAHQHGRGLLLDPEARHHRRVSSRQRDTSASLLGRVRFPLQPPRQASA